MLQRSVFGPFHRSASRFQAKKKACPTEEAGQAIETKASAKLLKAQVYRQHGP